MISKALKFYYPNLLRVSLSLFSQVKENTDLTITERRIRQCRYSNDLFFVFSQEQQMTPTVLTQYCYKLNNFYNREKPSSSLSRFLVAIKTTDRSNLKLEQLSNYAAICSSAWQINMKDKQLYSTIYNECKEKLKNIEQPIPIYALINLYRFFSKFQSRNNIQPIVDKLLQAIETMLVKDYIAIAKIISDRSLISNKEKKLLRNIIESVNKLLQQGKFNIGPKIKIYANMRRIFLSQPYYTSLSKSLTEMLNTLQQQLTSKMPQMNESNIFNLLQDLPPNNILYKMIVDQVFEAIDQEGNSNIAPQLISKLLKLISEKTNIKRVKKEKFNKIYKFVTKNIQDMHYNYQRDVLQMVKNGFFSINQFMELQRFFESQKILQNNREYIYQCFNHNILLNNYDAYEQFLSSFSPDIKNKNFITLSLTIKRLHQVYPQNQVYKKKNQQCINQIENVLPNNLNYSRTWRNIPQDRIEQFINQFGDYFIPKILKNIAESQRKQMSNDFLMILFFGNYQRNINTSFISTYSVLQLLDYVLVQPHRAVKRADFLDKYIGLCIENINKNLQSDKRADESINDDTQQQNRKSALSIHHQTFIRKIFNYLTNPDINQIVDSNQAPVFVNLGAKVIKYFSNEMNIPYFQQHVYSFLSVLKDSSKNNRSYHYLLSVLNDNKTLEKTSYNISQILSEMKAHGKIKKNYAIKFLQNNKNSDKKINDDLIQYLNAIAGNTQTLQGNITVNQRSLPIIFYVASNNPSANQPFIENNLSQIEKLIQSVKSTRYLAQILCNFNTDITRSSHNSAVSKMFMILLNKISTQINQSKKKYMLSSHIRLYDIVHKLQKVRIHHKQYRQFIESLCIYACNTHEQISYECHLLLLKICHDLNYSNEIYNDFVLQKIKNDGIKSTNLISQNKIEIISEISCLQPIKKNAFIKISHNNFRFNSKYFLNYYQNVLAFSQEKSIINQIKALLRNLNQNITLEQGLVKYFEIKSNGDLSSQLQQIKKAPTQINNEKIHILTNFIKKQAENKNVEIEQITECGISVLRIGQKYVYITPRQICQTNFRSQVEYIRTIFGDKIKTNESGDNILIIFTRFSKNKFLIKVLSDISKDLIPDQDQALQNLKEAFSASKQKSDEEISESDRQM